MKWKTRLCNALLLSMLSLLMSCGGGSSGGGNVGTGSTSPAPAPISSVDQVIRGQWNGMTDALLVGDKQTAMSYMTDDAQLKYGPVFDVLMPEFRQILPTWSPLLNSSTSGGRAEYAIVTDDGNKRQLFYVYFKLGDDGVWRLESM